MIAGPEELGAAVRRLREGGLVAFPTETVYGLGADALNAAAIRRVFDVKGRPSTNPLIVHVTDASMAKGLTTAWPASAEKLACEFWPGPLSIVLPRAPKVPAEATGGGPNVALRCPDHPTALSLLYAFGGPLVGPSANLSGHISPTCAEHVRESFSEEQVYVLDGGACERGIESTVLSLVGTPRVLRPGVITASQIEEVIGGRVETGAIVADAARTLESPGQLASHYAPRTPAWLVNSQDIPSAAAEFRPAVLLALSPRAEREGLRVIRMPVEDLTYAAALYRSLREADAQEARAILVETPPGNTDIWQAVWDRLSRAARRFRA